MKNVIRMMAIILSFAMIFAFSATAFAAGITKGSSNTQTLPKTYGVIPIRRIEASSEFVENGFTYKAERLIDGDKRTCWVEGADGFGIGEIITLYLDGTYDVSKMSITGGWAVNKEYFDHNAKPRVMYVYFSSSPYEYYTVTLDETMSTQNFQIDERGVKWVQFEIADVYPGHEDVFDTCISELTLYGK